MKRILISSALTLMLLVMLWGVYAQQQQLARLRAEQQQSVDRFNVSAPEASTAAAASPAVTPSSSELLRLRSEVAQLTRQRRDLSAAQAENDRLQTRIAMRVTNKVESAGVFIRSSEARFSGYSTPEATLQTTVWAMQNHDFTNFVQSFTPEMASDFMKEGRPEEFTKSIDTPPGVRILGRTQMPDGSVQLTIQPENSEKAEKTRFYLINGAWKISEHKED
jgi:hypothetical protein